MSEEGYNANRNSLKPLWVSTIELTPAGGGKKGEVVLAQYPLVMERGASACLCFSVRWFDNAHGQQHATTPVASDSVISEIMRGAPAPATQRKPRSWQRR